MISDAELQASLNYHESIFNAHPGNIRIMLISSKAAILVVCGWVEQAMDSVVLGAAQRCALSQSRITQVSKSYVKKTYGFQYENHFEKMIISVTGYKTLENVENSLGAPVAQMKSDLEYLGRLRNHYAHTHFESSNPYPQGFNSIPTPTVMRSHASTVFLGLSGIERELMQLGF